MKLLNIVLIILLSFFFVEISILQVFADDPFFPKISSTPHPVGSGARSLGIGAFIAVADDATSASWNPGALVILEDTETSIVFEGIHKIDRIHFSPNSESNSFQSISEENINFFSIAYPFTLINRNMIVSLSYQHLYDFNREWSFPMKLIHEDIDAKLIIDENVNYEQSGRLSAIGLSYCIEIKPGLSFGFTLNFWDDNLTKNEWQEGYYITGTDTIELPIDIPDLPEIPPGTFEYIDSHKYLLKGFNFNLGIYWAVNKKLILGWVFKSPFTADIEHTSFSLINQAGFEEDPIKIEYPGEELDMPMSIGIGFSYKIKDNFKIAGDLYRTDWQDCTYKRSSGIEESSISGDRIGESDIDPTYQIRFGMEYRFESPKKTHISIPVRTGIFYDPTPAVGNPDDYYGFNFGIGVNFLEKYIFDIAYRYRWGNNVGDSVIYNYPGDFSTDVSEYIMYSSLIVHF